MRRRKTRKTSALPLMMAELGLASLEVIGRRTLMMARGACSPIEYHRMVQEKAAAAASSARRLAAGGGTASAASLLAPWHSRAKANAKRLRRS
jgi:hypothetical protein